VWIRTPPRSAEPRFEQRARPGGWRISAGARYLDVRGKAVRRGRRAGTIAASGRQRDLRDRLGEAIRFALDGVVRSGDRQLRLDD